jgi:osmotically-inducible protein OsmY
MENNLEPDRFGPLPIDSVPFSDRNPFRARLQKRWDEEIQLAVTTAFLWDLAVPRHGVVVRVFGGWVTLTGRVELQSQKSCAEADARLTPGVVGVTNEIQCNQVG